MWREAGGRRRHAHHAPTANASRRSRISTTWKTIRCTSPNLDFWHVAARWLVSAEAANSISFMVGQSTFVKDAAHLLHKHDRGDEFFCVFDGEGSHLVEGDEWP